MSHITEMKTKIKRKDELLEALRELDMGSVLEDAQVHGWNGTLTPADIVVRRANGYDIGFVWDDESGSYDMIADWMFVGVEQGVIRAQVMREYSKHVAVEKAREAGWQNIQVKENNAGEILIVGQKR